MNRRGFTLVELLATLVVLGIIMGIVLVSTTSRFDDTKNKTEEAFVSTIEDAMNIYMNSDGKKLNYTDSVCTINKTHGIAYVYKTRITFDKVINSEYMPISQNDLINPANKDKKCSLGEDIIVDVYRDSDYVYYYKINGNMGCLINHSDISNLPSGCIE